MDLNTWTPDIRLFADIYFIGALVHLVLWGWSGQLYWPGVGSCSPRMEIVQNIVFWPFFLWMLVATCIAGFIVIVGQIIWELLRERKSETLRRVQDAFRN
jgi:hypothetical protein